MDVRLEIGLNSRPREILRRRSMAWTNYQIKATDGNDSDDDYAREKVLFLHCRNLAFRFLCAPSAPLRLRKFAPKNIAETQRAQRLRRKEFNLCHCPFSGSRSMSAIAERAISIIDLSALRIIKLESRTVVITPMMPPFVTTRSPIFRLAIVS